MDQALTAILPSTVEIVKGQVNRVPEPKSPDFVVMTVIRRERISTTFDAYPDCRFVGSVSGTTLTLSSLAFGALVAGRTLFGTGTTPDPIIATVGTGGLSATISVPLTVSSRTLAAGAKLLRQSTRVVIQLDVHGADQSTAADNAQLLSTVLRDDSGYRLFVQSGLPITPLFADDPKQIPFQNAEDQWESRYVVECHLQADQVVTLPQRYADAINPTLIPADVFYPA